MKTIWGMLGMAITAILIVAVVVTVLLSIISVLAVPVLAFIYVYTTYGVLTTLVSCLITSLISTLFAVGLLQYFYEQGKKVALK